MDLWMHVVGWSLVHFLWQGATLAIVSAGLLRLCRHRSPNTRYAVACGALAVMAVSYPVVPTGPPTLPTGFEEPPSDHERLYPAVQ